MPRVNIEEFSDDSEEMPKISTANFQKLVKHKKHQLALESNEGDDFFKTEDRNNRSQRKANGKREIKFN